MAKQGSSSSRRGKSSSAEKTPRSRTSSRGKVAGTASKRPENSTSRASKKTTRSSQARSEKQTSSTATAKTPARGSARKTTQAGKSSGKRTSKRLHLISDFTGNLANHLVSTVMSQYPDCEAERAIHRFCDSLEKIDKVLKPLRGPRDVILHAVIDSEAKRRIEEAALTKGIECLDLTGSLTEFLSRALGQQPTNDPDRVHKTDEQYFHRIDAMEFTLQHDDSRRLDTIDQADIVLVGLSRVSKSPTSTFLGSLGYKTANVSFAPELGLPKELKQCRGRIVGLTMQPKRLYEIRQRRFRLNRFATAFEERHESISYLDVREVTREVMAAESMYRAAGIPTIDVTQMTIEEAATHVLDKLGLLQ